MNDEPQHKHRKYWIFAVMALLVAFIAYAIADEALNQQIAFEIVKNNTDLCNFNHTSLICDGTRQDNVTYYTNETPIVLYVFAHASATGGVAGVFVYRDNVLIQAQSGRPLASPEQTWRAVTAIIPRNSSYRVNFTNYHHFEWYEDQILSGRNGTLNYYNITNTTTIGGGGVSFNGNPVDLNGSNLFNGTISNYTTLTYLNTSLNDKVNKTGDTMTGSLYVPDINNRNFSLSSNLSSVLQKGGSIHANKILKYINSTGADITSSQTDSSYAYIFSNNPDVFNGVNLITFQSVQNGSGHPYFIGRRALGSVLTNGTAYPLDIVDNTPLIGFNGAGWVNNAWSGSKVTMTFTSVGNWSTTSTGTKIDFGTTPNGSTSVATRMIIDDAGNITIPKLSGVGNAYVCVNATGVLYRGNPGC